VRDGGGAVRARAVTAAALVLLAAAPARAATVVIDDQDPPGAGLNDPTAFVPVGGNTATTLGDARLHVFQQAASIWGAQLFSVVPIHVSTHFTPLMCTSNSAVLASTGTTTVHRNFPNALLADTWYPQALANALAGTDLDPSNADIQTQFNSNLGNSGCLTGISWYLGLDAQPGPGQLDMLTTVLHEFAHGLGFQSFETVTSGTEFMGLADVFLRNSRQLGATPSDLSAMTDAQRLAANTSDPNLYWSGANVEGGASTFTAGLAAGHVRLYAPSTVQVGSTLSHFSTDLMPNELMEPAYTGPNRNLTLTLDLLHDVGWPLAPPPAPAVPASPGAVRWVLAATLALAAAARLRRRGGPCVR
jgi:hypothetical protein